MSSFVNSLNLRPQEKRAIVAIAVVVFVVLNIVLVIPRFKDYGQVQAQLKNTLLAITNDNVVIAADTNPVHGLQVQLASLEKQPEGVVAIKDIQLMDTLTAQAKALGVTIMSLSGIASSRIGPTNLSDKFFESQSTRITVQWPEDALVKFLYNVGNDPAMIRVRELDMHPMDNNRYKLNANITLIADYQKTNAPKPVLTATVAAPKPAVKPPAPAPATAAARSAPTNANPGSARRGPPVTNVPPSRGRAGTLTMPPAPPAPPATPAPPAPPAPPASGGSALPVPTRPARTAAGG